MVYVSDEAWYFADSYGAVCIDILAVIIVAAVTGFNVKSVRLVGFILALSSLVGDSIFFGISVSPTTSSGCNALSYLAMTAYCLSFACQNMILYSRIFAFRTVLNRPLKIFSSTMFCATIISNWVRLLGVQVHFEVALEDDRLPTCSAEFDTTASQVAFWISVVNEISISLLIIYLFYQHMFKAFTNTLNGTSTIGMQMKVLLQYSGFKTLFICGLFLVVAILNQTLDYSIASFGFLTDQLNSFISSLICFDSLSRDLINEGVEHKQSGKAQRADISSDQRNNNSSLKSVPLPFPNV